MSNLPLSGKIALVTGASRGIGQGIALQLGEAGATVYVTGRRPAESENGKQGLPALEEVANEITRRGGKGIVAYVDHSDMEQVKELFSKIEKEQNGQLDILVNNAYSAVSALFDNLGKLKFYQQDPEFWDSVNNVGLRNHYFCCVYGSRIMVKNGKGLIVNVSSKGGLSYLFNVAYGIGKEALDRMAADMAVELKSAGVTVVSLWPGAVKTQLVQKELDRGKAGMAAAFGEGETIEYAGKAVVALAADPKVINKTGRTLLASDLGDEYGFVDIDGRQPHNIRSLYFVLKRAGWTGVAAWCPAWIRLPGWLLIAVNSKL